MNNTALRAEAQSVNNTHMVFANEEHEKFYYEKLEQGEKITPKQWKAEIQSLQSKYDSISREKSKIATELAYAEVISYNRKNLERELQKWYSIRNTKRNLAGGRNEYI